MIRTISLGDKNINLIKDLGKGTYGSVYLIRLDGKLKAIKIISNKKNDGIRSLNEIDIMSKLDHPNLVQANGILVSIDKFVTVGIIMDLANTDLFKMIERSDFTTNKRFKVLSDITNGVKFLHDSGYIHLDLKPSNILIFSKGNAKITDFGLSYLLENGSKYLPSELVTITHRAPEILNGERKYTKASDIWSLGIIFFQVLSGKISLYKDFDKKTIIRTNMLLFGKRNIDKTLHKYIVGPNVISVIKQMLDFDPSKRPSVNTILKLLFNNVIVEGKVKYSSPLPPKSCDIMYYYGFDFMLRFATKIEIKTETFFLAADIYQRSIHYNSLSGNKKDWANLVILAITSIYMAIKMIESFDKNIKNMLRLIEELNEKLINKLADSILKTEAAIVQLFRGVVYSINLFTETEGLDRLIFTFKYLRNCFMYHKIDLNEWSKSNPSVYRSKYIKFSEFLPKTDYYKSVHSKEQDVYIKDMYQTDNK